MPNFLREMLKEIIQEELTALTDTPDAGDNSGSNSDKDKPEDKPTPNDKPEDKPTPEDKPEDKPNDKDAFNVELRKMIKSEVGGLMSDVLNKTPAKGANVNNVNVDDVYAKLLGFPTEKKGD